MSSQSSQDLESFLPVYDAIPEGWEDARAYLTEQLKKISNVVNTREIGYFLDRELLSGKQFIPGTTSPGNNPAEYRTVFRKVVDVAPMANPIVVGPNTRAHGITYDSSFTLIDLWVAATNSAGLTSLVISGNDVTLDATNINITSPIAANRAFAIIEYILHT